MNASKPVAGRLQPNSWLVLLMGSECNQVQPAAEQESKQARAEVWSGMGQATHFRVHALPWQLQECQLV